MPVFVFIDTNVLLHYQSFDQVDWHEQLGVAEVTLVFTPVVLSELDHQKWAGARKERARAKALVKKVTSLGLSATPVSTRRGVKALALDAEPADALFTQHRLHPQSSDDRLLASLLAFRDEHAQDRVVIVSADSGLGAKARSRRIEVVAPGAALELPDEPDEIERELEKTRRELVEVKGAAPDLQLTFAAGGTHGEFRLRRFKAIGTQTRRRLLAAWRKKHPYSKKVRHSIFERGTNKMVSFDVFDGLGGSATAADADKYNKQIDRVFAQFEAYLTSWPAALNQITRTVEFKLKLENSGTAPADDVDVQFWTDAPGTWRDKLPDLPAPPEMPKPKSPYDLDVRMPDVDIATKIVSPWDNVDGPNISGEGPDQRVQYSVRRVKHHVPCELPDVYFQFAADDKVASFTVSVRLVAANIRKPKTGSLHIEIGRDAPVPAPFPFEQDDDSGE